MISGGLLYQTMSLSLFNDMTSFIWMLYTTILIIHGGIYADLDTECFKSFDSLVDDIDTTIKNNSNSFIMAPKGAVYLIKFVDYLSRKQNVHQPLRFAGPLAFVDFEKHLNDDECFRNEGTYCEKNGLCHEGAYAVHYSKKVW